MELGFSQSTNRAGKTLVSSGSRCHAERREASRFRYNCYLWGKMNQINGRTRPGA